MIRDKIHFNLHVIDVVIDFRYTPQKEKNSWTWMCYKWHNSLERFYGIGNKRNDSKGDKFCFSIQKIQKVISLKTISKIMMI